MDSDTGAYPYPPDQGGHHAVLVFILVVVLAAILAAGAVLGMYLSRQNEAAQRATIRKSIYKSVRKALDKALQARGPELVIAARQLMKVTTQHLGPLFGAGRPISGPIDLINRALNGKIMDTAKPAPPAPQPVTHAASTHAQEQGKTTVVTPSVITNINVTPNGHGADGKHEAPPKPTERDMTVPEQLEELGKAVEALNRAWQPDAVDAFLAAAQKALLDAKPVEEKDDHGGGHGH
jgi:hypothetical protein